MSDPGKSVQVIGESPQAEPARWGTFGALHQLKPERDGRHGHVGQRPGRRLSTELNELGLAC
jgi:hypothetical protein